MKNLIIYIHPTHTFGREGETTAKIQIDNSIDVGWAPQDIILITNFPFEHNGVKAIVLGDHLFCPYKPVNSKVNAILELAKQNFFGSDLYWFHDLDLFQNEPYSEEEIAINQKDMALCNYGRMPLWNTGSLFFKKSAMDIFQKMIEVADMGQITEQDALFEITGDSFLDEAHQNEWGKRLKLLNVTYNFTPTNLPSNWIKEAQKPLKAVHFHLTPAMVDIFVRGKNRVYEMLVSYRLMKIFAAYGYI